MNLANKKKELPLHIAASQGRDSTVKLLIERGTDVNVKDDDGDTPLMAAVGRDQLTTISVLLGLGADKSIKNDRGKAPADVASNAATERLNANANTYQSFTKY